MGKCVVHPIQPDRKMVGMVGDIKASVSDLEAQSGGRWLPCDGRLIDQTAYPELYAASEVRFQTPPAQARCGTGPVTLWVGGKAVAHTVIRSANWRNGTLAWAQEQGTSLIRLIRPVEGIGWEGVDGVSFEGYSNGAYLYPLSPTVVLAGAWETEGSRARTFLSADNGASWTQLNEGAYLASPILVEENGEGYILAIGNVYGSGSYSTTFYMVRIRVSDGNVQKVTAVSGKGQRISNPSGCGMAYQNGEYVAVVGPLWFYGRLTNGELGACTADSRSNSLVVGLFNGTFWVADRQGYWTFASPYDTWKRTSTEQFSNLYAMITYQGSLLGIESGRIYTIDRVGQAEPVDIHFSGFTADSGRNTVYHVSDYELMGIPFVVGDLPDCLCCKWRQVPLEAETTDGRKVFILAK